MIIAIVWLMKSTGLAEIVFAYFVHYNDLKLLRYQGLLFGIWVRRSSAFSVFGE